MIEYALVSLDNDEGVFTTLCQSKKSLFNKNKSASYVDLITGEIIRQRSEKVNTGLTYSESPKTITEDAAARLLLAIKLVGENVYYDHVMEVKNKSVPTMGPTRR